MKKYLYILLSVIFIQSCSLFSDKNELIDLESDSNSNFVDFIDSLSVQILDVAEIDSN